MLSEHAEKHPYKIYMVDGACFDACHNGEMVRYKELIHG